MTHLNADTATDAELLGECRYFRVRSHFDAKFSHSHDGARPLALLPASLRLALV